MPAKNSVKIYLEGGYYHLYNRGVEKREIFVDEHDYNTFLFLLKTYLLLPSKGSDPKTAYYSKKNLNGQIELLAYCLMPNHFHLLVRQKYRSAISDLMRCVNVNYVAYFNNKYERVGSLFQGKFKAVLVDSDSYLLHLSRYIHLNPASRGKNFADYNYSSYLDYLGKRQNSWLNPKFILDYFKSAERTKLRDYFSYQAFIEDYRVDSEGILGDLVIETDH
ncbi:hypothetical protein A3H87_04615 [Candidatus Curtissbacteria bacterium RIFCSPLOWO2_02_FULL_42_37]|uniref:Transposase IS200-like domain-containing protein n=1 Tax=Candidatus Curtissbacteria bacterium RIFCSPLOWO2_01_FULL_42_50 TaxID=1797730 RepID=A0A1F5H4Z6_9BACT|nr:MAG: hypothetical protein A3C33_01375 [Candidatus Curtissbacteria bacterium RIFCSPHIGHO2_02_FULL_42_58]OGD99124.1 MAG: hypothetical protein A3B54_02830 [Candidatus Curtissbacteria bacterium RIFCSPLOWO2_01_FULL_42_50]OGE09937.1 MAG: hypothetical protein A3H87_04615 [Candidatus Curtissbacteria bacterium RIFCSPLOWO2_02_FULL_42_37]